MAHKVAATTFNTMLHAIYFSPKVIAILEQLKREMDKNIEQSKERIDGMGNQMDITFDKITK